MQPDLARFINDDENAELDESLVDPDPFRQFEKWFNMATETVSYEPNAMALATCGSNGIPSVRIVLLKEFENGYFVFYTNYESNKAIQIEQNPRASLLFWWPQLERQIRIEGKLYRCPTSESNHYFSSRPVQSRIAAIVSPQSRVIPSRDYLDQRFMKMLSMNQAEHVRPANWGGYRLEPDTFEYWQGRQHRLHDRIRYRKETTRWIIERLAP